VIKFLKFICYWLG